MPERASWLDVTWEESTELAKAYGLPGFRGRQIWQWIHRDHQMDYDGMTNLSKALREELKERCEITMVKAVRRQQSQIDETVKYLFEMADGQQIESVLMSYHHGYTVCVSSQAGCRMGCKFCASTLGGLVRNLTPGEMLQQIYRIEALEQVTVSNIVIMGCGEPFDNYDAVLQFLRILHDPQGHNMSYRNMTVSTCGLLEPLKRWIREELPVTLAISLHAPNDEIRQKTMPVAKSVSMDDLLSVCKAYTQQSGKRITFEYALVKDLNDTIEHAEELASRLKGLLCHVNLIPVNPVTERGLERPDMKRVNRFKQVLDQHHIQATVRRELGKDIDGACGQLRHKAAVSQEVSE